MCSWPRNSTGLPGGADRAGNLGLGGAVVAGLEAWCWAGTGSACSFGRDPQPFCAPVPSSVKWV